MKSNSKHKTNKKYRQHRKIRRKCRFASPRNEQINNRTPIIIKHSFFALLKLSSNYLATEVWTFPGLQRDVFANIFFIYTFLFIFDIHVVWFTRLCICLPSTARFSKNTIILKIGMLDHMKNTSWHTGFSYLPMSIQEYSFINKIDLWFNQLGLVTFVNTHFSL